MKLKQFEGLGEDLCYYNDYVEVVWEFQVNPRNKVQRIFLKNKCSTTEHVAYRPAPAGVL